MVRLTILVFLAGTSVAQAADVSYWTDVRPIFQAHCQGCHQPAKASGEYVMTDFARLLAGGDSGDSAVVPDEPDRSRLIDQITPVDGSAAMPQDAPPLSDTQIATITAWIRAGAIDDTPASAKQRYDADHPPEYSAAPVVTSLAFSPDGSQLAVSGYHEVVLHDASKILSANPSDSVAARLIGMSERIESVAYSPDGAFLAVAGGSPGRLGELQVWILADNSLLFSVPVSYDTCYGASWSSDGKLIAIGCPDNTVRAFDATNGKQVLFNGAHSDWVLDTVFSIDGVHLTTVSRDRSMKLIEVATERFIDNITSITPGALQGGLHAVDRHPENNQLLIGGADGVAKVYRMFREKDRKIGDDFNLIRKYPAMPGRIFDVTFSADGKKLVAGSSFNGEGHVHAFDVESGKQLQAMSDVPGAVYCIAITPDGRYIASGGFTGHVQIHDSDTGELVTQFVPVELSE